MAIIDPSLIDILGQEMPPLHDINFEGNEELQLDLSEVLTNAFMSITPPVLPVNVFWCGIDPVKASYGKNSSFNVSYYSPQVIIRCIPSYSGPNNSLVCYGCHISVLPDTDCTGGTTVRLSRRASGEIWLDCLSEHPVFIQSYHLGKKNPGFRQHEVSPGDYLKIFDLKEFCQEVVLDVATKQTASANLELDLLRNNCVASLWFDLGDGRLSDDCWCRIEFKEALAMLKDIFKQM